MRKYFSTTLAFLIISSAYAVDKGIIKGKVVDAQTSAGLALVQVILSGGIGTTTGVDGTFLITLKPGHYQLHFRHIAYDRKTIKVQLISGQKLDTLITLIPRVIPLPGVRIMANRSFEELAKILTPTPVEIEPRLLQNMPVAGEGDLFRTLEQLPSVTKSNEATARISVRGSNSDQNLILIDDIELFNPYHLFGLSGIFNTDLIGAAVLLPGGFPARYGNRLGSVIDVRTKQPDSIFSMTGHTSLISMAASVNGKIKKKLTYLAGFRHNYYDRLEKRGIGYLPYHFNDLNAKLTYTFAASHKFRISIFKSKDRYDHEASTEKEIAVNDMFYAYNSIHVYEINWENSGYALSWDGEFGRRLTTKSVYSSSSASDYYENSYKAKSILSPAPPGYDSAIAERNRVEKQEMGRKSNNRLKYRKFETNFSFHLLNSLTMNWGVVLAKYRFNYFWHELSLDDYWVYYMDNPPVNFRFDAAVTETAYYTEMIWHPVPLLVLSSGLRLSRWDSINKWYVNPRFNLKYVLTEDLSINLATGQFNQPIATAREKGMLTPVDLYFPTSLVNAIEQADHYIIAFDYRYKSNLVLSLACYSKIFKNLLTRYRKNPGFALESGSAKGIELKADFDFNRLTGYLSYTLSESMRQLDGYRYPSNYDQRHRAVVFANIDMGKNWTIDLNWDFHSGQPYDPGVCHAVIMLPGLNLDTMAPNYFWTETFEVEVKRGAIRYPYYHRLDIGSTKKYYLKSWTIAPYFRLMNAYWRKNVLYYDELRYEHIGIPGPDSKPFLYRRVNYLPTIPTVGVAISFK